MRIAHVNPDPGVAPGRRKGAAVHVEAMRHAFLEIGCEVLAVDTGEDREVRERLQAAHARAPLDLVYERHALARYAGAEFAREHGLPLVLEVNAPLATEEVAWRGRATPTDRSREEQAFSGAALVLCVSSEVASYARERGSHLSRTLVRPNAVDPERFRPRPEARALRERLFPPGAFVVGFHGRLRPWHHFELLAEALAIAIREGHPAYLLALGEGPFDEALAGRVAPERAVVVPWVPHEEAALYVACFDALALSYAPGSPCYFSPLKLLEAMAAGAVPVVPALGDLPSVISHEATGLVYAAGDAGALARALSRLVLDPSLRARIASAARAYACAHTWQRIAREVVDLVSAGRPA